jgi:hypothetical protein
MARTKKATPKAKTKAKTKAKPKAKHVELKSEVDATVTELEALRMSLVDFVEEYEVLVFHAAQDRIDNFENDTFPLAEGVLVLRDIRVLDGRLRRGVEALRKLEPKDVA